MDQRPVPLDSREAKARSGHHPTRPSAGRATSEPRRGESSGGGGGSRTRVRKHVVVGLYMRVRFVIFMPGVWKRLSTARPYPRKISQARAEAPRAHQPV